MPRHCSVCHYPEFKAVDRDLLEGKLTLGEISRKYGLSKSSLSRHRANCIGRRDDEAWFANLQGVAERLGVSVEEVEDHWEHHMFEFRAQWIQDHKGEIEAEGLGEVCARWLQEHEAEISAERAERLRGGGRQACACDQNPSESGAPARPGVRQR